MGELTDKAVKAAKATDNPIKLPDGEGLHLYVTPAGGKTWQYRYRYDGREKKLTIGRYPEISLLAARDARQEASKLLRAGRDPGEEKRLRRLAGVKASANTFESVARAWHARKARTWGEKHAATVLRSLERDVFPAIGISGIDHLTAPVIHGLISGIEERSAETASRICERLDKIFAYGIASGVAHVNPASVVRQNFSKPSNRKQPAIVELEEARKMLRQAEVSPAHPVTRLALRFLAVTAVRPGTIRGTAWSEFEELGGAEPLWRIPADRMKGLRAEKREHLVPLPRQAVELLEVLSKITGRGPLAFPNSRWAHRPMSANAIGYLLNRAGYNSRHVPHGWRSTFSTIMNERDPSNRWIYDLMLGHVADETVERRYNRSELMKLRRKIAQEWADLLLEDALPLTMLLSAPQR